MNLSIPKNESIRLALAFAMILPLACYPVFFAYFHNASEAPFSQVWRPLAVFVVVAAGFFILFASLTRDAVKGAFVSNIALFLFAYYRPFEDFIRDICWHIRFWHIVPVLFLVLLLLALHSQTMGDQGRQTLQRANRAIAIVLILLILFNGAMAIPTLFGKVQLARQGRTIATSYLSIGPSSSNHFPNVYYILLDEYSSFDMIRKHYGYDNLPFARFLESTGFTISHSSHNPSPRTPEVLAHLIGMDSFRVPPSFTVDENDRMVNLPLSFDLCYEIIAESQLTRFFKSFGYEIFVADMGRLFINHPVTLFSDHAYAPDDTGQAESTQNTLFGATISRSALYVLDMQLDTHLYNRMVNGIFDWIEIPRHLEKPIFLYAHIVCPHGPFSFDKDGQSISGGFDWQTKAYYLGQFIYVTDRISGIVRRLVENDPDCVIILQSDHSARMWGSRLPPLPLADMTSILNAVYFRGLPLAIEGLTGLDTGLTVYNRLFDTNIPLGGAR